ATAPLPPGQRLQTGPRLGLVHGLPERRAVEHDLRVDAERQRSALRRREPGARLPPRVLEHQGLRVALGDLLYVGGDDLERDAQRSEYLAPARGGRGEDQFAG